MENHLKMFLAKEKMTQRQLAEELNVTHQQINNWVSGRSAPGLETALRISKRFNVTVNELWFIAEQ